MKRRVRVLCVCSEKSRRRGLGYSLVSGVIFWFGLGGVFGLELTEEKGVVVGVVDGDTLDVAFMGGKEGRCWFGIGEVVRVRLLGVNTPEKDERGFLDGWDAARKWVRVHKEVRVVYSCGGEKARVGVRDKYGRLVGAVYPAGKGIGMLSPGDEGWYETRSLNSFLLDEGVAKMMVVRHNKTLDFLRDIIYEEAKMMRGAYGR